MRQYIDVTLSAEAQKAASSEAFAVGVKNAKGDDPAEIALYGEIGNPWDIADARSVSAFLRENKGKAVNVRINSMGGLAYDGITIHNALVAHDGPVTTIIEGMAGSAASIIAVGGDPVQIYENAHLFIHRAQMVAIGNVDAMNEAIAWLNKVDDAIARTYKAKTGKAFDKIMAMMRGSMDGTVMTAKEAVELKFADQVISLKTGAAKNAIDTPIDAKAAMGMVQSQIRTEQAMAVNAELCKAIRVRTRREHSWLTA